MLLQNNTNNCILGEYADFDHTAPTSKSGGKAVVIDMLKKQHGYKNLVLIGDGMTDLEACPPADAFIGNQILLLKLYHIINVINYFRLWWQCY